jgi:UDP-N-acetyl-D-mannosaminuronic acid dehydrogenase
MIANDFNMDFNRIRQVMSDGYGRAYNVPSAGFAAGPCLLKDTMQLAAFNNNNFFLGHAAMMINEGLPNYIVERLRHKHDITKKNIGIFGMAFKADIDDTRDSLSFKLGKILRFHGAKVFYSDEYVKDPTFIPKEELIKECDIVIIGAPHTAYKKLKFPKRVELIDLWGINKK